MRYTNPVTGGYPMTTIAAFIQLLPKGFATAPYRSTDATVFVAVEGRGRTRIGPDFVVDWQPRDIFVVPSWKQVTHEAADDAVLFSFSDRPIQEALHLFREERARCLSRAANAGRRASAAAVAEELLAEVARLPPDLITWQPAAGRLVGDGHPLSRPGVRAVLDGAGGAGRSNIRSRAWGRDHTDPDRLAAVTDTSATRDCRTSCRRFDRPPRSRRHVVARLSDADLDVEAAEPESAHGRQARPLHRRSTCSSGTSRSTSARSGATSTQYRQQG